MGGAKKTTWIGGTVVVGLLIVVAAWFLAISPALTSADEVRAQAEQARQQNELLELKLVQLKADFEKLPEYKAELAGLQTQIPSDAAMAEYFRQVDQIATAHSVTVTALTPSTPTAVTLAASTAPAPTETTEPTETGDGSTDATGTATSTDTAGAAGAVPTGFVAIPLSLTVLGTYDDTVAFLNDLQNATPRLFLVSGLTGTSQKEAEASGGKPATGPGDQELVVTGYVYVLPDALGMAATPDADAAPPALPGAVAGKNPLVPITGR
ncbi:type 4a pilus biogenesis protein PilO [Cellulomonas soli]